MTAAMTANLLALQQVSLQLGRSPRFLLKEISFEIKAGEVIALLGNQGSGKTLLLQLINGLKYPSQGQIQWQGKALSQTSPIALRRQIAWLPQQPRLLGMTGKEAIAYPLKLQGLNNSQIQQRLDHWLEILKLPLPWLDQSEEALSQPAAQAIALTRALAIAPQLLLLDNPWPQSPGSPLNSAIETSTVHQSSSQPAWENPQKQVGQALTHFTQAGGTVIWAVTEKPTSTLEDINLVQRLLCIHQGQLTGNDLAKPATWQQALAQLAHASSSPSPHAESDEWDD